jgi:hypothetical protein
MRLFPIQMPTRLSEQLEVQRAGFASLRAIPWDMIGPHEAQAERNHDQSLKTLARRCGLSACEAVAILEDREWRAMPLIESYEKLDGMVRDFHRARASNIVDV